MERSSVKTDVLCDMAVKLQSYEGHNAEGLSCLTYCILKKNVTLFMLLLTTVSYCSVSLLVLQLLKVS